MKSANNSLRSKGAAVIAVALLSSLLMSSCGLFNLGIAKDPLGTQLSGASKIVFTNCKEKALKITVSDSSVIGQIASIISKRKAAGSTPGVNGDYAMRFYLPDGSQKNFTYWMGAADYNKYVNFMDEDGNYYLVSENLDTYIVSSTKMQKRPKHFVQLYSAAVSQYVSTLQKAKDGTTTVGVDIASDRMVRKYTESYEDEQIYKGISADGYSVMQYNEGGKYTYVVTYVTEIYTPEKARINIQARKSSDNTVLSASADYKLAGGRWQRVEGGKQTEDTK